MQLVRRLRWHLHWKLRPGTPVMLTLPGGMTIRLGETSASYGMYLGKGYCDKEAVEIITRHLGPGMVMLDCGAHIGEYTLIGAAAIGPDAEVHCFEPDPRTFQYLKENVERNQLHNVVLNQCGVGETTGETAFYLGDDPTASSVSIEKNPVDTIRIQIQNLTEYAAQRDLARVDVIKIDVEGQELAAVRGASDLIAKYRPSLLFIECDDHANEMPLAKLLREFGYRVVHRDHGGIHPHLLAYHDPH